jgi:uncharacterized membrane protein YesL
VILWIVMNLLLFAVAGFLPAVRVVVNVSRPSRQPSLPEVVC